DRSLQATWLTFTISNKHPTDTMDLYFYSGVSELTNVYQNNQSIGTAGVYKVPTVDQPNRHFIPLKILPGDEQTYWVRSVILINPVTRVVSQLYTPEALRRVIQSDAINLPPLLLVMGILVGCLLFMTCYAAYHYYLNRDRSFLYYALYVGSCFVSAVIHVDVRFGLAWLYPQLHEMRFPLAIALIFAFYMMFISHLLGFKPWQPSRKNLILPLLLVLIAQQAITVFEFFYGKLLFADNFYYRFQLIPSAAAILLLLWLIIRSNSPIKKYLLAGSLGLVIISLVPSFANVYLFNVSRLSGYFLNYLQFWSYLGLVVECFCFALALAYRVRLVEIEKNRLQQNYTQQLKAELETRSKEIEEKNKELEEQHIKQIQTAFEHKLAETEMTALRAQINPHFIFNCLNSIKFFATPDNGNLAAEYLTKFSRLMRLVLENSSLQKITLQNELEALELYLQMEVMRFNHKLSYQIQVQPEIDKEFVEIPPLLLQPYVENAIWHGIMHKKKGGHVIVRIEQSALDILRVTITDNGIGRAKAAALKSKSATRHKSFGMKVTSERIRLINQLYKSVTEVQVFDLVDSQQEACGTEVMITIPTSNLSPIC
ncbi:MAG TPA: histidine kinase, partial [Chryseolinea sp.]|nr:histidine kinase [Chryseolinea sp.]